MKSKTFFYVSAPFSIGLEEPKDRTEGHCSLAPSAGGPEVAPFHQQKAAYCSSYITLGEGMIRKTLRTTAPPSGREGNCWGILVPPWGTRSESTCMTRPSPGNLDHFWVELFEELQQGLHSLSCVDDVLAMQQERGDNTLLSTWIYNQSNEGFTK